MIMDKNLNTRNSFLKNKKPYGFNFANLNPLKGIAFHGTVKSSRCKAEQGFERGILLVYVERRSRSDNAADGFFTKPS